jgi:hypothetical protein
MIYFITEILCVALLNYVDNNIIIISSILILDNN